MKEFFSLVQPGHRWVQPVEPILWIGLDTMQWWVGWGVFFQS
jgi:hypothetical protein